MRKNVALFAALLLALALLSGCAGEVKERALVDLTDVLIDAGVSAPEEDAWEDAAARATLYFLNESGENLVPVSREIAVPGGMTLAQAALTALLSGPEEGESGAYWPELGNVRAEAWAEFCGEVATVNLPARARALTPQMLYAVRLAIARTLTEISGVNYVNVLVDGREEGLDLGATLPVGTLSRVQDLDAGAQYRRLAEQGQMAGVARLTTLFFPTADGAHVLCAVRSVSYASVSAIDCLYMLLSELGKSADQPLAALSMPAPMDYIEEMPEIVRTQEGTYRAIDLRFGAGLDEALAQAGLTRGVYLAMLADTLLGFVPGVDGLLVSIGSEQVTALDAAQTPDAVALTFEQGLITRAAFAGYTGSPVTLYAPDAGSGKLVSVQRVLNQEKQNSPRERLLGLMALGSEGALPEGLGDADILAAYVQGDRVLLNLSSAFARALSALTPEQERLAVYAMVNTLTEDASLSSVTFFFGGAQVSELAGGLEMRGSFLRNPGMVVR